MCKPKKKRTESERCNPEYLKRKYKNRNERRKQERIKDRLERLNLSPEEYVEYKIKNAKEKELLSERRVLRGKRRVLMDERRAIRNSPEHKAQIMQRKKDRERRYGKNQCKINYFKYMVSRLQQRIKNCYPITKLDLYRIAKQQKLICPLTGRKLHRGNISIDHIKTVSSGGTNHPSNLRFVHQDANTARHTLPDEELYKLALDIVETMTPQINA